MAILAVLKGELGKEANVFVGFIDLTMPELDLLKTTSGEYYLTQVEEFEPQTGEVKEVFFKVIEKNEVIEKFDQFRYMNVLDNPNIVVNGKNYRLKTKRNGLSFNFYANIGSQFQIKKVIEEIIGFDFSCLLENERILFNEMPYERNKSMINSKTGDLYFSNGRLYKFEYLVNYHSEIRYSAMFTKWSKTNKRFENESEVKEVRDRMFYVGKII